MRNKWDYNKDFELKTSYFTVSFCLVLYVFLSFACRTVSCWLLFSSWPWTLSLWTAATLQPILLNKAVKCSQRAEPQRWTHPFVSNGWVQVRRVDTTTASKSKMEVTFRAAVQTWTVPALSPSVCWFVSSTLSRGAVAEVLLLTDHPIPQHLERKKLLVTFLNRSVISATIWGNNPGVQPEYKLTLNTFVGKLCSKRK